MSIANLLSETTPILTFQGNAINNNPHGGNGFIQNQNNHIQSSNESELTKAIQEQNELLLKQNVELIELVKVLKGK